MPLKLMERSYHVISPCHQLPFRPAGYRAEDFIKIISLSGVSASRATRSSKAQALLTWLHLNGEAEGLKEQTGNAPLVSH